MLGVPIHVLRMLNFLHALQLGMPTMYGNHSIALLTLMTASQCDINETIILDTAKLKKEYGLAVCRVNLMLDPFLIVVSVSTRTSATPMSGSTTATPKEIAAPTATSSQVGHAVHTEDPSWSHGAYCRQDPLPVWNEESDRPDPRSWHVCSTPSTSTHTLS